MDYNNLASESSEARTVKALRTKGYEVLVVKNGNDALTKIKEIIPDGASVMNGSSVTLEQIGYVDYLASGNHKWIDWHAKVHAENDRDKRAKLRKEAEMSDFYLGSVNALTETGEFIIASNTASQIPQIAYTSPNLIFVVSTKKIVPDLSIAMKRIEDYVLPLEDEHLMKKFGAHTSLNKVLFFKGESQHLGRKIHFILVEENLGY